MFSPELPTVHAPRVRISYLYNEIASSHVQFSLPYLFIRYPDIPFRYALDVALGSLITPFLRATLIVIHNTHTHYR